MVPARYTWQVFSLRRIEPAPVGRNTCRMRQPACGRYSHAFTCGCELSGRYTPNSCSSLPHIPDTIPGRIPPQPPPLVIDGEEEWEVEEILDSQKKPRTRLPILRNMEYLVRWKGYGPEHNSWEPAENLENSPELVETFHRRFPNALRYH